MLGQGKKLNVVDQRPSSKVHSLEPSEMIKKKAPLPPKSVLSLKFDSSSYKMPETEENENLFWQSILLLSTESSKW
ncbi:hypothetical protein RDI58_011492 [Solanum bulbocastanum]|uniref:Uncharacterized protein n=1 Tax=Solanum bulbocastanum TaxID=147425 RepID=A0AAN8TY38_SOLBU